MDSYLPPLSYPNFASRDAVVLVTTKNTAGIGENDWNGSTVLVEAMQVAMSAGKIGIAAVQVIVGWKKGWEEGWARQQAAMRNSGNARALTVSPKRRATRSLNGILNLGFEGTEPVLEEDEEDDGEGSGDDGESEWGGDSGARGGG